MVPGTWQGSSVIQDLKDQYQRRVHSLSGDMSKNASQNPG